MSRAGGSAKSATLGERDAEDDAVFMIACWVVNVEDARVSGLDGGGRRARPTPREDERRALRCTLSAAVMTTCTASIRIADDCID